LENRAISKASTKKELWKSICREKANRIISKDG